MSAQIVVSSALDFDNVNLDHWSWEGKVTPEILMAYLQWMSDISRWLVTEGKVLLEKEHLTFEEFDLLSRKVTVLVAEMPAKRAMSVLVQMLFRKGAASLLQVMRRDQGAHPSRRDGEWDRSLLWYRSLAGWVEPKAILGLGSRQCRDEDSRELIESLVPILQIARDDHLLRSLAAYRYPNEVEAQNFWIGKHKNW